MYIYMSVGTGGGDCPLPHILPTKIIGLLKSLKITTYKSVYTNKDKIGF